MPEEAARPKMSESEVGPPVAILKFIFAAAHGGKE
jgi:hypothetical protein